MKHAQDAGAAAVILFSDPADDGYGRGEPYPEGTWRPQDGVQRGSVMFLSLCPGDPARAAVGKGPEEACGYSREDLLPRIPVIPISARDAQLFMAALRGPDAPWEWRGKLDGVRYRLGPSPPGVHARMVVDNKQEVVTMWNVIAVISGRLSPEQDQPVVLGNHRDAWVFGASGAHSYIASLACWS